MLAFWARSLQDKTFLPVTLVLLLIQRLETSSDETSALAAPRPPLAVCVEGISQSRQRPGLPSGSAGLCSLEAVELQPNISEHSHT